MVGFNRPTYTSQPNSNFIGHWRKVMRATITSCGYFLFKIGGRKVAIYARPGEHSNGTHFNARSRKTALNHLTRVKTYSWGKRSQTKICMNYLAILFF